MRLPRITHEAGLAYTPDEIEWVYALGPKSSMTFPPSWFNSDGIHPVRVYGAGDLALAYLLECDSVAKTKIFVARAVVWPEKKICSSIYGEEKNMLAYLLLMSGYSLGALYGARLRKVQLANGGYVIPFIDPTPAMPAPHVTPSKNCLVIVPPNYEDGRVYSAMTHSGNTKEEDGQSRIVQTFYKDALMV